MSDTPTPKPVRCQQCAHSRAMGFNWFKCLLGIQGPSRAGFWNARKAHPCERFTSKNPTNHEQQTQTGKHMNAIIKDLPGSTILETLKAHLSAMNSKRGDLAKLEAEKKRWLAITKEPTLDLAEIRNKLVEALADGETDTVQSLRADLERGKAKLEEIEGARRQLSEVEKEITALSLDIQAMAEVEKGLQYSMLKEQAEQMTAQYREKLDELAGCFLLIRSMAELAEKYGNPIIPVYARYGAFFELPFPLMGMIPTVTLNKHFESNGPEATAARAKAGDMVKAALEGFRQ